MKLTHIHPFFLALCVWGLPVHMILTHGNGVRLTQSPEPRPGVTCPLGQDTKAMVGRLTMCKQARSLGPPGTLERSVGIISSPHNCPWEVRPLLYSLWFCVIFCWFEKIMLELNTLPWFWQTLSFLSCWDTEKIAELGWKTRGSSVLFGGGSRLEGDHSSNLTCCPLTFRPIPVPWNQLTRCTCLPTQTECAGKLE